MLADDVVGVVRPALRATPPGRLVNEYTLAATGVGGLGGAASVTAAPSPSATVHMAGRLLTDHDIDLGEFLHSNGFRVLAAEDTAALATVATIPVQQSSNHLLMVAPTAFERNELAASDNFFMSSAATAVRDDTGALDTAGTPASVAAVVGSDAAGADALRRAVLGEFASLYTLLTSRCPGGVGARVHLFTHEVLDGTPDAVFPNNWFSTHTNLETDAAAGACTLVFYPMRAANRRLERRPALLARLEGFRRYTHVIDLSRQETAADPRFLEGTGSLVLDRIHRVAYAAISERTDARLAAAWGRLLGYTVVPFRAVDGGGRPIYHTNVMMAIGTRWAVVAADAIHDAAERAAVLDGLATGGREVVTISTAQVAAFCGNVLEVEGHDGAPVLVASTRAVQALEADQRERLEGVLPLRHAAIPTLEAVGGGGVRCAIGELF
ncbi:hypothetical protein MMPV_001412 [Pyropia vietnamensis]